MRKPLVVIVAGLMLGFSAYAASEPPAWTPPKTTVAKELVEVGKFLLEHGMADPRGGKFAVAKTSRRIRPLLGFDDFNTIGWIKEAGGQRYIVDLSGLASPVGSDFKEVPIGDAVKRVLEIQASINVAWGCSSEQLKGEDLLFSKLRTDEAVVLLLISGHAHEAESLFANRALRACQNGQLKSVVDFRPKDQLQLVERFLQRTMSHAVEDYAGGDDEGALEASTIVVNNTEAYRRYVSSFVQDQPMAANMKDREPPVLRLLTHAAKLRDQLLHREKDRPDKVDWPAFDKLPQKERIKRLISMLEDVRPSLVCGSLLAYGGEQPIDRLIGEDLAAGDALVECIQNDKRYTRGERQPLMDNPTDGLVSVKTVAKIVLKAIMKLDGSSEYDQGPDRDAKLLSYWKEVKHLTPAERWLKVLRQANAQPIQWIYASQWFLKPENDATKPPICDPRKPLPPARFQSLPKSLKSELAGLFLERAKEMRDSGSREPYERIYLLSNNLELAVAAFNIDPAQARTYLLERSTTVCQDKASVGKDAWSLQSNLARAFGCLIQAGDQSAARNYAAWLKDLKTDAVDMPTVFLPLSLLNPSEANSIVNDLLSSPSSTFFIDPNDSVKKLSMVENMARSPLLYYSSFRSAYERLLAVVLNAGSIKFDTKNHIATIDGGLISRAIRYEPVETDDAPGPDAAICRVCDYYASQIAVNGAPEFKIYWSTERKDAAIKKLIAYLNEHYKDIAYEAQKYRVWKL